MKKRKPDWPFVFFDAVNQWPKHCEEIVDRQVEENESVLQTGFSDYMPLAQMDSSSCYFPMNIKGYELLHQKSKNMIHIKANEEKNPVWNKLIENGGIDKNQVKFDHDGRTQRDVDSFEGNPSDTEDQEIDLFKTVRDDYEPPDLRLRDYQIELAETALEGKNTIICAPTGCGKTRVATHIIKSHLEDNDNGQTRKVAFLARTVPLVLQQCAGLEKFLPKDYRITNITGENEHSMEMHMLLPDYDIFVMTPKILENHLLRGYIENLGEFSLIVFDECHHTREGEPYNTLMLSYIKKKKDPTVKLPQVVGLSASIGVEDAKSVPEAVKHILKVCGNLDCDNISAVEEHLEELKKVVPVPEEISFQLRERSKDDIVKSIQKIMMKLEDEVKRYIKDLGNGNIKDGKPPPDRKSQQYNQWAVSVRNLARSEPLSREDEETNMSVRSLMIICDYLMAYNVALEIYDLVQLVDVLEYLKKKFIHFKANERKCIGEEIYFKHFEELERCVKNKKTDMNANLEQLAGLLDKHLIKKEENSCGIIFVKTRAMTIALVSWIGRHRIKELKALNPEPFTGSGASADEGGMTQSDQDAATQRFKSGETRLLISTSVAEEGLDIPECNLVIKYNHVGNEVTTLQTRGRSRKKGGLSILLAMDRIRKKEIINKARAKLMTQAIDKIRKMPLEERRRNLEEHQAEILNEAAIAEMLKAREEKTLEDRPFSLVCRLCRKVSIDRKDIKLINGSHRVNVDRNLLDMIQVWPNGKEKPIDDMRLIGSARCKGEPEPGKFCFQKLGSVMIFRATPFVVLSIASFGFDLGAGDEKLRFFKYWKEAKYKLGHFEVSDITRYLPVPEKSDGIDSGFQEENKAVRPTVASEDTSTPPMKPRMDTDETKESGDHDQALQTPETAISTDNPSLSVPKSTNNSDGKPPLAPPKVPERRDSLNSSTQLKTVNPSRSAAVDSGHGSAYSDTSNDEITEAKQLLHPATNLQPSAQLAAPQRDLLSLASEDSSAQPAAPQRDLSLISEDSQTPVMSETSAQLAKQRKDDFLLNMQAQKLLDDSPKLTCSSMGTSIAPSESSKQDAASQASGGSDESSIKLLISSSSSD